MKRSYIVILEATIGRRWRRLCRRMKCERDCHAPTLRAKEIVGVVAMPRSSSPPPVAAQRPLPQFLSRGTEDACRFFATRHEGRSYLQRTLGRRSSSVCAALAMLAWISTSVLRAAEFYVTTNGSDVTGDGSAAAPYRTFDKAHAMLAAGDDIIVGPGVYLTNRLRITKSGTPNNPIEVKPLPGVAPVLDMLWRDQPCVLIYGAHVIVEGFELRNTSNMCARLHGESNVLRRCKAHHAVSHGIMTSGTNNVIEGCEVYMTVLENVTRTAPGWGSAVKVYFGGKNSLIAGNVVYHNYGEGICVTRGMGAVVRQNVSFDNFSVLIYVDNSYDVLVEKNHCYSLQHSGFTRDGRTAAGIALAEEQYSGWGARLRNVRVINNVVCFADRGCVYYGSDVPGGGLSNVVVAYNTFWGSSGTAVSIEYESAKLGGSYIANNLVQQPQGAVAWLDDRYVGKSGLKLLHNFWVGEKPAEWRNCNGPGDRTGAVAFVSLPVVTDAFSFVLAEGSAPCGGATNIFGITEDYGGALRPAAPAAHDMGAFQAIPEGGAALAGMLIAWHVGCLRKEQRPARGRPLSSRRKATQVIPQMAGEPGACLEPGGVGLCACRWPYRGLCRAGATRRVVVR